MRKRNFIQAFFVVLIMAVGFGCGGNNKPVPCDPNEPCGGGVLSPTATLVANPVTITPGQSSTLTWTSTNATSCSAYWTTSTAISGSGIVTPSVTTTYNVGCVNKTGQMANASATVTVGVSPTCQDRNATNYGGTLPCTYPTPTPTPTIFTMSADAKAELDVRVTCPDGTVVTVHVIGTATATATGATPTEAYDNAYKKAYIIAVANANAKASVSVVCGGGSPTPTPTPTCQDPTATNFGGPLPCRWPTPPPPPQTCQDPRASNYGRPLPCIYPPPPTPTPTPPPPPACTYQVQTSPQNFGYQGGTGGFSVSTNRSGCPWNAVSNASWITMTGGSSGSGNGSPTYAVSANSGPARTGTISVAGKTVTVTQDAAPPPPPACTYQVESSVAISYQGGSGGFSVSTSAGTCSWTAVSNVGWIAVTAGSSGTGNGSVSYMVAGNGGSARTGTITAAGKTVTITQDAHP